VEKAEGELREVLWERGRETIVITTTAIDPYRRRF
jgi:hypothetical protein